MYEGVLQPALQFLESWLYYRARQVDIPGFTIAISHEGRVIFSKAYGLADIETNEPLTTKHLFGVASQSKMFTATAILQLAGQGKLDLDDKVVTHIPWLAEHRDRRVQQITIRQLLAHSAGLIRDGVATDFWELKQPFPDSEALRRETLVAQLAFQPGTVLKYSNLGYALLGQVIVAASGQSYDTYLEQNIIRPAWLHDTFADYDPKFDARLAAAYGLLYEHRRKSLYPRLPTNTFAAAVGVHTTAEDMCRFMQMQVMGEARLLSDNLKQLAHAGQQALVHGYDAGAEFGLGFETHYVGDHRLIGHDGHLAGFSTATLLDPDTQISVAVMANCTGAPSTNIVYGIFEIFDWFAQADATSSLSLGQFAGRFTNATSTIEVAAHSDRAIAFNPDDWRPFTDAETLDPIDSRILRVSTPGSVFNAGETMHYHFADDAIQAVRYAGFTMLPEIAERSPLGEASQNPDQWLTFADLEQLELRIGRITEVRYLSMNGSTRLVIDFGPIIGTQTAFVPDLRPGALKLLHGQTVLGALFPFWHTGKRKEEVVVLGLTNGQQATYGSLLPGSLFPLVPNPNAPRIYSSRNVVQQTAHFTRELQHGIFRVQALPEYPVDEHEDSTPMQAPSILAWKQGKRRKAMAILDKNYNHKPPNWLKPGLQHVRLLLIDDVPTPYQQWTMAFMKRIAMPRGEKTYLVDRKDIVDLDLPDGDFTIWDQKRVTVNGYAQNHWTYTAAYDAGRQDTIEHFLTMQQKLIQIAQTKGEEVTNQ